MSNSIPNPLLSDPSIVQVNSESTNSNFNSTTNSKFNELSINTNNDSSDASNALSKLLDSAMLNAAKESSPEFEIKVSSNPNSNSNSPKTSKFKGINPIKKDFEYVYSIETLLSMKNLADENISNDLPPKEFWCLFKKPPTFQKELPARKKDRLQKREFEPRRQKKIENSDEPDWDSEFTENVKLEMGDTVEDFEKWKQAQRKKNGEFEEIKGEIPTSVSSSSGNDVDNFFSFVKQSSSENSDDKKANDHKASRFSSFFTPGPSSSSPASAPLPVSIPEIKNQSQPQSQSQSNPSSQNQNQNPSHSPVNSPIEVKEKSDKSSRFFSGSDKSSAPSTPSTPSLSKDPRNSPLQQQKQPQQPQQQPQQLQQGPPPGFPMGGFPPHPQMPHGIPPNQLPPGMSFPFPPPPGGQPAANDSFFMSLMSKKSDGSNSNQPPSNQIQNNQGSNQQQQQQPPPQMQGIPPWLNNQQMAMGGQFPPGFQGRGTQNPEDKDKNPNQNSNPNQIPGFPPFHQQGDRNGGRNGNNMPFPFPPHPGMIPPGMPLPPGMIPPQFRDQNIPINNQNQQQFMPFPPGMIPNRGPQQQPPPNHHQQQQPLPSNQQGK